MNTDLANDIKYQVTQLVRDFGVSATLRRKVKGAYQLGQGSTDGADTNSDETVRMVLVSRKDAFSELLRRSLDGGGTVVSDRMALIASTDLTKDPGPDDQLVGDGVTVVIVSAHRMRMAGIDLGWAAEVQNL